MKIVVAEYKERLFFNLWCGFNVRYGTLASYFVESANTEIAYSSVLLSNSNTFYLAI